MVRCPSHGADRVFDGGDPTALQEAVGLLLDAADIPTPICDAVSVLVDLGEALVHEGGAFVVPERLITRGLEGVRRRDAERYDETDTDEEIDRELVRACLGAVLGLEAANG